ncbi:MAG: hypothetical protein ACFFCQ_12320 [Promethearchaeota archaeon]
MIKLDASSLIYAVKANYLPLLKELYGSLIVIDTVYEEVVTRGKQARKRDAYVLEKMIEEEILKRHPDAKKPPKVPLGKGEIAVIYSAKQENCKALIDDQKARKVAVQNDVDVKWTSLAFLVALKTNLITDVEFDELLTKFVQVANPSIIEYKTILEMKKLMK